MPVEDRCAVTKYLTREYWRMGSSTFLDALSWGKPFTTHMNEYAHDQQTQRILRAASLLWQRQAQQALDDQKAQYEASGKLHIVERG